MMLYLDRCSDAVIILTGCSKHYERIQNTLEVGKSQHHPTNKYMRL